MTLEFPDESLLSLENYILITLVLCQATETPGQVIGITGRAIGIAGRAIGIAGRATGIPC